MLGRKNFKEKLRQMEMQSKKDRFSIRKLAVGAVSVLLGFSFLGMNSQTARADSIDSGQSSSVASIDKKQAISNTDAAADNISNNSDTVNDNKVKQPELTTFSGLSAFLREDTDEETPASSKPTSKPTETSVPVTTPNQQPVNNGKDQQTQPVSSDKEQQPAKEPQPVNSGKNQEQAKQPNLLADAAKILQDEVTAGTTFTASDSFKQADSAKQEVLNTAIKSGQDLLTKYRALTMATSLESETHKDDQDKLVSASSNQQPISSTEIVNSGVNQKALVDQLNTTVTADELTNAAKNIAQAIAEIKSTVEGQADPVISTRANHMDSSGHTTQDQFTWSNWNTTNHTVTMQAYTGHDTVVSVPPTITKDGQTYTVTDISHKVKLGEGYSRGYAFNGDNFIKSLTIPGTIKTLYCGTLKLGEDAGDSQLRRFVWEDGGTKITNSNDRFNLELLYCNPHLTYVQLPNTLTTIDVQSGGTNAGMPVGIINAQTLTSTLLRINDLDVLFGPGGFNTLYGYTKLNDQSVDPNYYILDVNNQMIAPDVIRYTKKDGTPMPVEVSNVTGATYSNGVFTVNQGVTSITYKATVKMAELGQKDVSINVKLNVRPRVPNVNITTKNISLHTASPTLYSPADTFVSGKDESGNVAQWNSPGMEYMITDSVNRLINANDVINRADTYKTNYSYTYGKDNDQIYDSPLSTATITVYTPKAVNGASVSSEIPITAAPKEYISNSNDLTQFNAKYEYVKDINGTPYLGGDKPKFTWTPGNNHGQLFVKVSYFKDANQTLADGSEIVPVDMTIIPESTTSANNVIVHHWIQRPDGTLTTTTVPGMSDTYVDGKVNDRVTVSAADTAQKAPNGYTLVTTTDQTSGVITSSGHQEVTFYYTANLVNNITVHFINKDGHEVDSSKTYVPSGHVDDTTDFSSSNTAMIAVMPTGYHYATGSEIPSGHSQPANIKWDTEPHTVNVYVAGDQIDDTHNSAKEIVIHYKDVKTDQDVAGSATYAPAGHVGATLYLSGSKIESGIDGHKPKGYHLATADELTANGRTQEASKTWSNVGQTATVYVAGDQIDDTHNSAKEIIIHYKDVKTDQDVAGSATYAPAGHVGDTLYLSGSKIESGIDGHKPKGYHLATADELTANGRTQEASKTWSNVGQTATVYVAGDQIDDTHNSAKEIIIHYKDVKTDQDVAGSATYAPAGHVGDTLYLSGSKIESGIDGHKPKGYHLATADELTANGRTQEASKTWSNVGQTATVYVAGDQIDDTHNSDKEIVIHYKDVKTDQDVAGSATYAPAGHVGDTLYLSGSKIESGIDGHKPKGYHLATADELTANGRTQEASKTWSNVGQTATVYVAGDQIDDTHNSAKEIIIHYKDVKTDQDVAGSATYAPAGHVGDTLYLSGSKIESGIDGHKPKGYHLATADELTANGRTQEASRTWSNVGQTATVYVAGDQIDDTHNSAKEIIIHYKDVKTDQDVAGSATYAPAGHVGDTLYLSGSKIESGIDGHKPAGYHLATADELTANGRTQEASKTWSNVGQTATVYVAGDQIDDTHNSAKEIIIHYKDVKTDQDVAGSATYAPAGHVGDTLYLSGSKIESGIDGHKPAGYHLATADELTANGRTQEASRTWSNVGQTATVYVAGDQIDDTHNSDKEIIIHYKDVKTDQDVAGSATYAPAGHVGDTLYLSGSKIESGIDGHKPKGYHLATADELTANGRTQEASKTWSNVGQTATVYVAGDQIDDTHNSTKEIIIHYKDVKTDQDVAGSATYAPAGHVGDTLYLSGSKIESGIDGHKPKGYHLATADELTANGRTQEASRTWSNVGQTATVYVAGDQIDDTHNSDKEIIIHYKDVKTDQDVAGSATYAPAGHVGDTLYLSGSKIESGIDGHKPKGYHLATADELTANGRTQEASRTWSNVGQTATVYVAGDQIDDTHNSAKEIIIHYKDVKTDQDVAGSATYAPAGHVGDTLYLSGSKIESGIDGHKPVGYHLATADELTANGRTQEASRTWSNVGQTATVYVAGDQIDDTHDSDKEIIIHYKDVKTDQDIAGSATYAPAGHVGDTLYLSGSKIESGIDEHKPVGYHLATADELTANGRTQEASRTWSNVGQTATVYVAGDAVNGITVHFINKDGHEVDSSKTYVPSGHVGDTVDFSSSNTAMIAAIPTGYHYATGSELPSGHSQPANIKWDTEPHTVNVYVAGDQIDDTHNSAKEIIIHYKDVKTDQDVAGSATYAPAGHVGDTLYLSGSKIESGIDGHKPVGYHLATADELTANGRTQEASRPWSNVGQTATVYVAGDQIDDTHNSAKKIIIHYKDVKTDQDVAGSATYAPAGHVGDTLYLSGSKIESGIDGHKPAGYHLATADELTANGRTQEASRTWSNVGQTATVYVAGDQIDDTHNSDKEIIIHYKDVKTDQDVAGSATYAPAGHVGDTLYLSGSKIESGIDGHKPAGYHLATADELTANGRTQEASKTWSNVGQTATVYVAGDQIDDTHNSTKEIIIHYKDVKTDQDVAGSATYAPAGHVGDTLYLSGSKIESGIDGHKPKGYHLATADELTANGRTQEASRTWSNVGPDSNSVCSWRPDR